MPPVWFELTIPASERPQTHALDRAASGIGHLLTAVVNRERFALSVSKLYYKIDYAPFKCMVPVILLRYVLPFDMRLQCVRWPFLGNVWDLCFFKITLCPFYDRMAVHRNRFLVNKTNRRTEFQFYWYYDSTCFGQPFRPSSGVLSRTSAFVHFMQLWWPFATRSRMELHSSSILLLVANDHER